MSSDDPTLVEPAPRPSSAVLVVPLLVGALVAVGLGVYGKVHEPQFFAVNVAGFSSPVAVKAWVASLAAALAIFQFGSAAAMYGKLGVRGPAWVSEAHVWSGRFAVLITVPVAVHCLFALGFQDTDSRVLLHSLGGCFFYGAFVAKMLLLSRRRAPGWAVPVIGGAVFTALIAVWLTSALWFFRTNGIVF